MQDIFIASSICVAVVVSTYKSGIVRRLLLQLVKAGVKKRNYPP